MPTHSPSPLHHEHSAPELVARLDVSLCFLDPQLCPQWIRPPRPSQVGCAEVPGDDWREALTQSRELRRLAEQVRASGSSYEGMFVLPGPDGGRELDLTLAPVRDSDGHLTGIMLCALDLSQHERAVAALADAAETCQMLADYSLDWEYWIGPDGQLRWMSPACQQVSGYSVAAFLADPRLLESVIHPDDRERFSAHLHGAPCTSPATQMRVRLLRPSGEVRWIEHVCKALYWPDGVFAGRRSANRDVTETMQIEQALRESENQFRLMFELATVGMVVIEPASRRPLRVNESLCRILGYDEAELLQMDFNELTHPDDRDYDGIRYQRAVRQEDADYFVEKRYLRKDGQVVWTLVNATFIRDPEGQPLRALAAIIDITGRRRAEARARELATVVECSSDFIGIAGLDRRCLYLNRAGRKLVGLAPDDALPGIRIEDFFLPEDRPFLAETIMPALDRSGRWTGEFRFRHFQTQEPIDVFYDALRIDDPETGRPLQYATVTRDIRKEKAAEEALLEADRRKDEFLAMLGHELRNPMAPIRNAVEIIRSIGIGEDRRIAWAVDVLDRQTAHMGRLLDDLLDVSRIVRDRIELDSHEVELRDVVRQSVDGVFAMMRERHHHFVFELPSPEVRVQGDPVRLSQILLNLLVNAAKYTPDHGEIRVDSEVGAGEVLIRVRDNGQGMSAAQIESILGLRPQGRASQDILSQGVAPNAGLGLGLTIARRLAELHGGILEAASEGVGRGAELRLRLPLLVQAPQSVALKPDAESLAVDSLEPLRILIVDDNPDVAGALAMLLEIHGYQVETASSGPEAIERVRHFQPRVAFLDIGIPGMDGLELARRLRQRHPDSESLMLVALTGLGHEQAREQSLAAGFDEHLVKPLEQKTLLSLLRRLS